jgi:hypothetical protein
MSSLEESLGSVQRQVRQLRLITALLAVALLLSVIVPSRELRASRFVLLDDAGQQRGVLRVSDGVPALLLQDAAGSWRAVLSVDEEAASLFLTRADGESGVALAAGDGTSSLTLYGAGGTPEMELRTSPAGPVAMLPGGVTPPK